jgi:hypothetical protein
MNGFSMSSTEVTNAQYERFDPSHRALRGKDGFSVKDDEAVVFVSWNDATLFCKWLSKREGKTYRLPTEAEWEYACRAKTKEPFSSGDVPPDDQGSKSKLRERGKHIDLTVGDTKPNGFGLYEMHGNVEEWCSDWYGPYDPDNRVDPGGPDQGDFRVVRGGSRMATPHHVRSANRMAAMPDDRSSLLGFRVVCSDADPNISTVKPPVPKWATDVRSERFEWPSRRTRPVFVAPIPYVKIEKDANGPLYTTHNHCPSITWCENGDLLAIWFSTQKESGREMAIAASRLRLGARAWEQADLFFKVADRNMTGSSLFNDGKGTLWHFNGVCSGSYWEKLALVCRTSKDNGQTWSTPWFADPNHRRRNQVISGTFMTSQGWLVQPCDATPLGEGGTALHISKDGGDTWFDPGLGKPKPVFANGGQGAWIAGIHAGVVELGDGWLMAYGRGDSIPNAQGVEHMPMSVSHDGGTTWSYFDSPWPPLAGGQRLVLMRLREGPLLLVSFTDPSSTKAPEGMAFTDKEGHTTTGYGMFAAVSYDDGATWPVKRLITDGITRDLDGGGWTGKFTMDGEHAEPRGYLAATESPDGMVHLLSSRLYYRFNLAWLERR